MDYYYLADVELKANKQKEYHEYWPKNSIARRLEKGAEHVATFTVISGAESTVHVKRLFRILDFTTWVKGETHNYRPDYWAELCYNVKLTLLAPEPYSELERFLVKGVSESEKPANYYYFADVEIKANKQKEYHEYWPKKGIKKHRDDGAEHVATFTVISGTESTTHCKRLFKIVDLEKWVKGETHNYHSDYWNELCYDVKCTLLAPEPYSHLR
jgi:hypothetical protein